MLRKLSLSGIRSRLKDYIVLFSGLVIAAAIFYMFEALATNTSFIHSNATIGSAVLIFQLGSILLGIITLVYILYANSFLMTMRQKDYATYMMLGAKSRKIGQLIFAETLIIGLLATIIGIIVGTGLAFGVGNLLISRMGGGIHHFMPLYWPAVLITFAFFIILFFIAATINRHQLLKKPILSLMRVDDTPTNIKYRPKLWFFEALLGIAFLATGYYTMVRLGILGLVIALVTIVLGSFFVFNALTIWVLMLLQRSKLAKKGLNGFTMAQLTFRIQDYTRLLSMISILFALALGAITVGLGYYNQVPLMAEKSGSAYSSVVYDADQTDLRNIAKLNVKERRHYVYKSDGKNVYWDAAQFEKKPLLLINNTETTLEKVVYQRASVKQLAIKGSDANNALTDLLTPDLQGKDQQLLSTQAFNQLRLANHRLDAVQVKDFKTDLPTIKTLYNAQVAKHPALAASLGNKYAFYLELITLFSGFEFMGFFLGLAFLAMLASCLMFKILSGAASDIVRYQMLDKIGARQKLLHHAVSKEVGVLFLLPSVLGVIHVLFGLQMFKSIMIAPYFKIWIPFTIFLVLYLIYYLLTTYLYRNIVLKRPK